MTCPAPRDQLLDRFELSFVLDGQDERVPLARCWDMSFETVPPVRKFGSYRGQRSFPGFWWFSTTGEHVGYESWLERDHVLRLDSDPSVIGLASQPFRLYWSSGEEPRHHVPDYFARLRDGIGLVVDVRADGKIGCKDAEAFEVTATACDSVGWRYERVGELEPILAANLRWLAGYRHPRCRRPDHADALLRHFRRPGYLLDGVRAVGDPIAVLPALFHLLWRRELVTDLSNAPLSSTSVISQREVRP